MSIMPTYLDYNATAPLRPAAREAMLRVLDDPGNASSIHGFGRAARRAIETAREQVAALAGTVPAQVVFTSGATESNNAVLQAFRGEPVAVSAIEHASILDAAPDATRLAVTPAGLIDDAAFAAAIDRARPALLSLILVNNETGVIQDVAALARRARAIHPAIHVHTDATQAAGRIPLDFGALGVDYMSLSAHKLGGPQGVGALILAPGVRPARLLLGGGQEKRQRAGTENVAGIAGFGAAAADALALLDAFPQLRAWHDRFERALSEAAPDTVIIGADSPRIANTSLIAMPGLMAQTQLMNLDLAGIAVSSGAACSSGTVKPSHVLQAMGLPPSVTASSIRVSSGHASTAADFDHLRETWIALRRRLQR